MPKISNSKGIAPNSGLKYRWGRLKSAIFQKYSYISETVQNGTELLVRVLSNDATSYDPNYL